MFILKSKYLEIGIKADDLDTLAVDKDGFLQHPLDGIVGVDGETTLASLVAGALGIAIDEATIPKEALAWCNSNEVTNHIWKANIEI
jgi:hypothetical protein